jgi:hypothetical protein
VFGVVLCHAFDQSDTESLKLLPKGTHHGRTNVTTLIEDAVEAVESGDANPKGSDVHVAVAVCGPDKLMANMRAVSKDMRKRSIYVDVHHETFIF